MLAQPEDLARFHAGLACDDCQGYIATSLAERAKEFEAEHFKKDYAKLFARALLDKTCKGGKALTSETRAALKNLAEVSTRQASMSDCGTKRT